MGGRRARPRVEGRVRALLEAAEFVFGGVPMIRERRSPVADRRRGRGRRRREAPRCLAVEASHQRIRSGRIDVAYPRRSRRPAHDHHRRDPAVLGHRRSGGGKRRTSGNAVATVVDAMALAVVACMLPRDGPALVYQAQEYAVVVVLHHAEGRPGGGEEGRGGDLPRYPPRGRGFAPVRELDSESILLGHYIPPQQPTYCLLLGVVLGGVLQSCGGCG